MVPDKRLHPSPYIVLDALTFFIKSKFKKNVFIINPDIIRPLRDLSVDYKFIAWVQKEENLLSKFFGKERDLRFINELGDLIETDLDNLLNLLAENVSPLVFYKNLSDPKIIDVLAGTKYKPIPMLYRAKSMSLVIDKFKYVSDEIFKNSNLTYAIDFRSAISESKYVKSKSARLSKRIDDFI